MPGIMDLTQVVQEATRDFGDLIACEPQRRHLGEYLTGLMIARGGLGWLALGPFSIPLLTGIGCRFGLPGCLR